MEKEKELKTERINLKIRKSLHRKINNRADREERSFSSTVHMMLEEAKS